MTGPKRPAQLALTYLPVMNDLFRTSPLDVATWLRILLLTAVVAAVVAVEKRWRRPRSDGSAPSPRSGAIAAPGDRGDHSAPAGPRY